MNKVAIILINYKQHKITMECIESIKKSNFKDYTIIVVDNNSQDESIKEFNKLKDIIVIESKENNGFSSGCNIGIEYAKKNGAEYILLLNNDTIIDDDMITYLIEKCDDNCVCVPKMYYFYDKDLIWYAGGKISKSKGLAIHIGIGEKDNSKYDKEIDVDFATGCCILIPIKVIEKVGLLDEIYFMYCEDLDYSIRLKENNIKIKYIPNAKLWHKIGASAGKKSKLNEYYSTRNRFYIIEKYKKHFFITSYYYSLFTRYIRILQSKMKKDEMYKTIIKAIKDYKNEIMGKVESFN